MFPNWCIVQLSPDTMRRDEAFDYVEELLSNPDNYDLEIKREQSTRSGTQEKRPTTSNELLFEDIIPNNSNKGYKAIKEVYLDIKNPYIVDNSIVEYEQDAFNVFQVRGVLIKLQKNSKKWVMMALLYKKISNFLENLWHLVNKENIVYIFFKNKPIQYWNCFKYSHENNIRKGCAFSFFFNKTK